MSFTVSLMFFLVSAQLVIFTSGEIFSDRKADGKREKKRAERR